MKTITINLTSIFTTILIGFADGIKYILQTVAFLGIFYFIASTMFGFRITRVTITSENSHSVKVHEYFNPNKREEAALSLHDLKRVDKYVNDMKNEMKNEQGIEEKNVNGVKL